MFSISCLAVKDNELYGYDNSSESFNKISLNDQITEIKAVYRSVNNAFIFTNDGLYGIGCNKFSQLGISTKDYELNFVKIPFYQNVIDVLTCPSYTIIWSDDGLYVSGGIGRFGIKYGKFTKIPFSHKIISVYGNEICLLINSDNGLYIIGRMIKNICRNIFIKLDFCGTIQNVAYRSSTIHIASDVGLFAIDYNTENCLYFIELLSQDVKEVYPYVNNNVVKIDGKFYDMYVCKSESKPGYFTKLVEFPYKADCFFHREKHIYSTPDNKLYNNYKHLASFDSKIIRIINNSFVQTLDGLYDLQGKLLFKDPGICA